MARLAGISGAEAVKAFAKAGWQVRNTVGDHVVMTKAGARANLSIPQHKEVGRGLLRKQISKASMTVDQFLALL